MGVRNSEDLGNKLFIISERLYTNQNLCKLLKNTSINPFDCEDYENPKKDILHKNVKVVPLVKEEDFNTESCVCLVFTDGSVGGNTEYKAISLDVNVYVPLAKWQVNDINLRPYLIMSEVEKSLKGKRVDGLGVLSYYGFELKLLTDNMSCYRMSFGFNEFN